MDINYVICISIKGVYQLVNLHIKLVIFILMSSMSMSPYLFISCDPDVTRSVTVGLLQLLTSLGYVR